MSSSSRPVRNRLLLVGLDGLAVGTLQIERLRKSIRSWLKSQLADKDEAGIPEDVVAIHVLEGTDGHLVNVLRAAAKKCGVVFYEPAPEELIEARVRGYLHLPARAFAVTEADSVLHPARYFQAKAHEAWTLVGAAERERDEAVAKGDRERAANEVLSGLFEPLRDRNLRLEELLRKLCRRRQSLRIALSMSTGRERVEELKKQLRERDERYSDLEDLVEQRGATIRRQRDQLDAWEDALRIATTEPVVAKKPSAKVVAKPAAKKKVPKFAKLRDLADWLLEQRLLNAPNLAIHAKAQGFTYKNPEAIIQNAVARRDMNSGSK